MRDVGGKDGGEQQGGRRSAEPSARRVRQHRRTAEFGGAADRDQPRLVRQRARHDRHERRRAEEVQDAGCRQQRNEEQPDPAGGDHPSSCPPRAAGRSGSPASMTGDSPGTPRGRSAARPGPPRRPRTSPPNTTTMPHQTGAAGRPAPSNAPLAAAATGATPVSSPARAGPQRSHRRVPEDERHRGDHHREVADRRPVAGGDPARRRRTLDVHADHARTRPRRSTRHGSTPPTARGRRSTGTASTVNPASHQQATTAQHHAHRSARPAPATKTPPAVTTAAAPTSRAGGPSSLEQRTEHADQHRRAGHRDGDHRRFRMRHTAHHRHVEQHQPGSPRRRRASSHSRPRGRGTRTPGPSGEQTSITAAAAYRRACTVNSGASISVRETPTLEPTTTIPATPAIVGRHTCRC